MTKNGMRPIHPGEILKHEYLEPLGLSVNQLAKHLRVPVSRMNDIVLQRRGISPDTALRLAKLFGGDAQSWMNLQNAYDLKKAEGEIKELVNGIVPYTTLAAAHDERFALAA